MDVKQVVASGIQSVLVDERSGVGGSLRWLALLRCISATKQDLKALELATKSELKDLERRLAMRLGGMIGAGVAILAVLMTLL